MASISQTKRLLISTGVLSSLAMAARLLLTSSSSSSSSVFSTLYTSLRTWFTPPYLYIVVNSIILSIAASSRFQSVQNAEEGGIRPSEAVEVVKFAPSVVEEQRDGCEDDVDVKKEEEKGAVVQEEVKVGEDEEEYVISRSSWTRSRTRRDTEETSMEDATEVEEKPLASARFSARRSVKQGPQGTHSNI